MALEIIQNIAIVYPKVFLAVVILASLALLVKSSDMLLFGITHYASRLHLSDYITGLVVVAVVTSFPELVSSVTGALLGDHNIVFGTILGSNIGGLTLVIGIMALISKKLDIRNKLFSNVRPIIFGLVLFPFILVIDGTLSRIDGGLLTLAYIGYVVFLWRKEEGSGHMRKTIKVRTIWKDGLVFILALGALLLSARWLIFGVTQLSQRLDISTFIVSAVLLGIGAQIPDLIVIIRSEIQGHKDVGMGDIIGSTIAKQLLFLGLISLFVPLTVSINTIAVSAVTLLVATALVLYFMGHGVITWKGGLLAIGIYGVYLLIEVVILAG
jgi:cation:H+ antiporter